MKLLVLSREDVTESTVQNGFATAGISVEERDRAQNDLDDPFSELLFLYIFMKIKVTEKYRHKQTDNTRQHISAHTSASHK